MTSFEAFVAWRYLRSKGSRAGRITIAVGVAILAVALAFYLMKKHFDGIHPFQLTPTQDTLKVVGHWGGVAALALGIMVIVFGVFRSLQSIFTTISSFGVFLGTAALVIVLSVMNGFEADLRKKILGSNAHVLVARERGEFTEWREVETKIAGVCVRANCVVATTPYVTSEVVVAADTNYGTAVIKGIDPATVGHVTDLQKNVAQGSIQALYPVSPDAGLPAPDAGGPTDFSGGDEPIDFSVAPDAGPVRVPGFAQPIRPDPRVLGLDGILVGRELSRNLHLYVGQEVQIVSPIGRDTPTGQVPRVRPFRVAGTFFSGMYEYDQKYVYVTLPALQSFLSLGDEVNGIEVKVSDMDDTGSIVAALQAQLGPDYLVQDWKEINRSLFASLKLEKVVMFIILTIIILVASLSIVLNLIMVVVEKQREIAILKSVGASDFAVLKIFVYEGLFIGILGTLFGIVVGLGACVALDVLGFPISSEVYYIDRLPVAMDFAVIAMVAVAGVAISVAATLYPAWIGARLRPVDGLRK
jgi:lipoprotein-releasing system permease protein